MTEQLGMDEFLIEHHTTDKTTRLVPKDYMHTIEQSVANELKSHLTKDFAISASELAEMFKIDTRQLRDVITTIRAKQYTKIIGDVNGYYIGTEEEFNEWYKARIKRSISSLKTTLDLNPEVIKIFYWFLNTYDKTG
ncbi:MAG: hypothetical protein WC319_12160, partial [Candidatus Paceibacterota bacterium]